MAIYSRSQSHYTCNTSLIHKRSNSLNLPFKIIETMLRVKTDTSLHKFIAKSGGGVGTTTPYIPT